MIMKTKILAAIVAVMGVCAAQATLYTFTYSSGFANGGVVPDGTTTGWSDTRDLSGFGTDTLIQDVNVRLNISGGYNGDLYGYLVHSSGFAVLLNRSGRTASDDYGYGDAGFNITLDGSGSTDIHSYGGNGGSQLTGTYQEDARNVDPLTVVDTDSRSAYLSSFNSLDPNGSWALFLADLSSGETSTVVTWGLDIEAIPEPITWALIMFGGVLGTVKLGHHLRRRKQA